MYNGSIRTNKRLAIAIEQISDPSEISVSFRRLFYAEMDADERNIAGSLGALELWTHITQDRLYINHLENVGLGPNNFETLWQTSVVWPQVL